MNERYDPNAESLATFLETGDPGNLPAALTESAGAFNAHARQIAPSPTFEARLEARLLAQHRAQATPRASGWQRLAAAFRPVGRLAWVAAVLLIGVGLALVLRGWPQGSAGPSGGPLPASCLPANEHEATYLNAAGGYCTSLSLASVPIQQVGTQSTILIGNAGGGDSQAAITIETHDAEPGESSRSFFERFIAPMSVDPSFWTARDVAFAGTTAVLREPKENGIQLPYQLFAVVGERAYVLAYMDDEANLIRPQSDALWQHILAHFAVLPDEVTVRYAACQPTDNEGVLYSVQGFCLRYPNDLVQFSSGYREKTPSVWILFDQSLPNQFVIQALDDKGEPLEQLAVPSFMDGHFPAEQRSVTVDGQPGIATDREDAGITSHIIATRKNGRLYYLFFTESSDGSETSWQLLLDSFRFVEPLIEPPAPIEGMPTPVSQADMLLTATPAPPPTATSEGTIATPVAVPTTTAAAESPYTLTELVRAPSLVVDGWSPDGQWVSYWEVEEDMGMSARGQQLLSDRGGTTLCTPEGASDLYDKIFATDPWLADGRFVYSGADGSLRLLAEPCGSPAILAPANSWLMPLASSADGQQMLLMGQGHLWLWREGDAEPTRVGDESLTIFPGATFSPDGQFVMVRHGPSTTVPATQISQIDTTRREVMWTLDIERYADPVGGTENGPGETPIWLDANRVVLAAPDSRPQVVGLDDSQFPLDQVMGITLPESVAKEGIVESETHLLYWVQPFEGDYQLYIRDKATGAVEESRYTSRAARFILAPRGGDMLAMDGTETDVATIAFRPAGSDLWQSGLRTSGAIATAWLSGEARYAIGGVEGLTIIQLSWTENSVEMNQSVITADQVLALDSTPGGDALSAILQVPDGQRLVIVEEP